MDARTVLIVENDHDIGELLQQILDELVIPSVLVPSERAAVRQVCENKPSLILLDLGLPTNTRTYVMLQELKSDPCTRHIPVIMLSGLRPEESERIAQETGADAFLCKPFELEELHAKLRDFVGGTQSRRAERSCV